MAYLQTSDERFYKGLQYPAGYFDAPDFSANNAYVLAEGLRNAGYGFAEDLLDYDFYDLGYLEPGSYTVKVDAYNWDFSVNSSLIRPGLDLYKNGLNTFEFDLLGQIEFIVEKAAPYSIRVGGWSSFGTEYRVYYTYNGPVEGQNNPAIFTNPTYSTTNGLNVGSTVSVNLFISDLDGLTAPFYLTYWYLDGVNIRNTSGVQFLISESDVGGQLAFRVGFEDDLGNFELSPLYVIGEIINDNSPPVNTPPVGVPVLQGLPEPGEKITIDTGTITDSDGLGIFSYQWMRDGIAIQGAQSSSYQVTWADLYSEIEVQVTYVDGGGTSESLRSGPIGPIENVLTRDDVPIITGGLSTNTEVAIQQIFVGLLGRPVKESGKLYWKDAIDSDNGFGITEFMWNTVNEQQEYIDAFSGATRKEAVTLHFNFLFGRDPMFQVRDDNPEWNYWVDGEGSVIPVNELVLALLLGGQGDDLIVLSNKIYVADYITENQPELASPLGLDVLGAITKDLSSVGLALQAVDLFA